MKESIKGFVSRSGLWSLYDEYVWAKEYRKLKNEGYPTLADWKNSGHEKRKGDTFYILGSGFSVSRMTGDQWDEVRNGFSIGFNNWFLHPFVPDIYGLELLNESELYDAQIRGLRKADSGLYDIPLLLHHGHAVSSRRDLNQLPWKKENIFRNLPLTLHTNNRRILRSYIRKNLKHGNPDKLLHYSASVGMWADLGLKLGYKKIVLIGIDMNDPRYFYEAPEFEEESQDFIEVQKRYLMKTQRNATLHATADKKISARYGSLPVDEYLYLLRDELHSIDPEYQLYVGDASSRLSKEFDEFDWRSASR